MIWDWGSCLKEEACATFIKVSYSELSPCKLPLSISARYHERHKYKVLRERKLEDAVRSDLSSVVASREGNLVVVI